MSKILLISSNITEDPFPVYPIGVSFIASALKQKGHEVRQFDLLVSGKGNTFLEESIKTFGPEFVGISVRNIDNLDSCSDKTDWYIGDIRDLVAFIRSQSDAVVIAGGAGFSIMPEAVLDEIRADYGVAGEGETAVCKLIDSLVNEGAQEKKIWKSDRLLEGSEIPSPYRDKKLADHYIRNNSIINVQTKRGCPYRCSYCSYPFLEGARFRYREKEAVIEEIEKLVRDFNVESVTFTDSVFNDTSDRFLEIAEKIVQKGIKIKWTAFLRPSAIRKDALRLLKKSGLYAVEAGTDASSDITLAGINKNFTFDEVMNFNDLAVEEKIAVAHFILFGGPGETEKTLKEGLENIRRLKNCVVFGFMGIRILPNTQIYSIAVDEGIVSPSDSLLKPVFYFSEGIDPETMNRKIIETFKTRKALIYPPSESHMRLSAMRLFGFKGLLWDRMVIFGS